MTSGPVPGAAGTSPGIPTPTNATLLWDAENRLVKATVGNTVVTYDYDYRSRLVRRTEVVGTTATTVTQYLYDGWNRIAEYNVTTEDSSSTYTRAKTYLWGLDLSGSTQGAGGVGGLLSIVDVGASTHYFPTYDGNGNVSEYINQSGTKAAHFEYDPFGNLTVDSSNNASFFPYRFSTKPQDVVTGLLYYGYRFYDPLNGCWMSKDPIKELGHWVIDDSHLRAYNLASLLLGGQVYCNSIIFVGNSPITFIDSNGEFGWLGAAIGGAVGAVIGAVTGGVSGGIAGAISGAVGGLVGGAVFGATLNPALAGAAAGAASSITNQLLHKENPLTAKNLTKTAVSASVGALVGYAGGYIISEAPTISSSAVDVLTGLASGMGGGAGELLIDTEAATMDKSKELEEKLKKDIEQIDNDCVE